MGTEGRKTERVVLKDEVVTKQPPKLEDIWMPFPKSVPIGVSAELSYLFSVDTLIINRRLDLINEFIGWKVPNSYTVTDGNGKHMYYAMEFSSCPNMFFCGGNRRVELCVYDNSHKEVIKFIKPLYLGCCSCCAMKMNVYSPPDSFIGSVKLQCNPCCFRFMVTDSLGNNKYYVKGPCKCALNVCNIKFKIISTETKKEIGQIEKFQMEYLAKWFGGIRTYVARIPVDEDVNVKALFLGLFFLVDYYFLDL